MKESIFKKALGSIVEIEDSPATPKKGHAMISPTATSVSSSPSYQAGPTDKEQSDKFHAHFDSLLKGANLPGPDYYELQKIDETLKAHIPDEHTRMIAAFASLQAQSSVTKDIIISSAQKYIGVIQNDRDGFQKALDEKQSVEVEARKKQIENLTQEILATKKQIDDLNSMIVKNTSSIQKLNTEAAEIEADLHKNEQAYLNACNEMIAKIAADIEKAKTTL